MNSAAKPIVVVADDDPDLSNLLSYYLTDWGYDVHCAVTKQTLFAELARTDADMVLLDLHLGNDSGLDVLSELSKSRFTAPIVILTAHGSINTAVQAIKLGAYDYVTKPLELERLELLVQHATEKHRLKKRVAGLEQLVEKNTASQPMLGDSRAMQRVREMIAEAAPSNATVLILGESGTGKELVARAVHEQSLRARSIFVPVNMAALPAGLAESVLFGHEKGAFTGADCLQKGWCEMAHKGTLFLDEIGEMEISLQAKLLRFLQEQQLQRVGSSHMHTVDVRIVAATNRNPLELVEEGRLRGDLYYRLNVLPIQLPPLRDRREDIPLLATAFLHRAAEANGKDVTGFTSAAIEVLQQNDWPGNIRQLENLVQRLVILSRNPQIGVEAIPPEYMLSPPLTPGIASGTGTAAFTFGPGSAAVTFGTGAATNVTRATADAMRPAPVESPGPHKSLIPAPASIITTSISGPAVPPPAGITAAAFEAATDQAELRPIDFMEKQAILQALANCGGNVVQAAQTLGMGQATIYRKIKRYGIALKRSRSLLTAAARSS